MSAFEVTPEILGEFQTEANENIEHTEAALLSLERSEKPREAIQEIFRCIHTIKGSADYLGLGDIKELSHAFENILDGLRKADQPVMPKELSDLSFKILDGIKDMIAAAALGREHGVAWKELLGELTRFGAPHEARALSSVEQSPSTGGGDAKAVRIFKDSVGQQCNILTRVREKLEANQPIDPGVRGMACRALQGIGNASQFVGEEELETLSGEFKTWLSSPESSGDAGEFIHRIDGFLPKVREVLGSLCERREGRHDAVPEPEGFSSESSKEEVSPGERLSESKTIRVNQDVLDVFMNLIGELLVARNAFAHVQHGLGGGEEERVAALREFRESSRHLTHVTGELQRSVMKMRMVPVKTLFQRYPRIVRDVCRKTEKTVEVVFEGEDTEIDKGVADELAEPLIHIVRNAVDHGIESAEHRRAAGKAEFGTLIMKASHEGNFMVVEVVDDGDGIDLQRIKAKALDRGLLTSEQADKITKAELLEYIFAPGFSTAAALTEISGRGVGLDVVKAAVERVKGSISVGTEPHQGTCFRIEVPLTMAIMRSLLIESDQAIYAIALQDVRETVRVSYGELKSIHRRTALALRGEVIMVERLGELLGRAPQHEGLFDARLSILILQVKGQRFGLIVDAVLRQEEIVVKPLPDSYAGVPGLAGASILGDGNAILILDAGQLYELISGRGVASGEMQAKQDSPLLR